MVPAVGWLHSKLFPDPHWITSPPSPAPPPTTARPVRTLPSRSAGRRLARPVRVPVCDLGRGGGGGDVEPEWNAARVPPAASHRATNGKQNGPGYYIYASSLE